MPTTKATPAVQDAEKEDEKLIRKSFAVLPELDARIQRVADQVFGGDWSKAARHILDVVTSEEDLLKEVIVRKLKV
jgi:hypothetical protein